MPRAIHHGRPIVERAIDGGPVRRETPDGFAHGNGSSSHWAWAHQHRERGAVRRVVGIRGDAISG